MQLSEQAQAILLLTAWLGKQDVVGAKPLTPMEWGRFALFLRDAGRNPGDLLRVPDIAALLSGFEDKRVTPERICQLLARSAALAIALEKWQRAGLWIVTRSDVDYPKLWKLRLKNEAPPVLFGAGNRDLLNRGGIAVVGSRNLDDTQMIFTGQLGRHIAQQGLTVVSGGARGADEAAMTGALEAEGMAVGVLADSLLRACTSARYRKALMRNDLVLVSPFNPEAGFNTGNAMARNKYIYCLSDAAIVIEATENKGGTWAGAIENLKKGWVPLWVRSSHASGNRALVEQGAHWLPEDDVDVAQLAMWYGTAVSVPAIVSRVAEKDAVYPAPQAVDDEVCCPIKQTPDVSQALISGTNHRQIADAPAATCPSVLPASSYEMFLGCLGELLRQQRLSLKELQSATGLKLKQLSEWLRQAAGQGIVAKTRSPVKYYLRSEDSEDNGERAAGRKRKTDSVPVIGKNVQSGFDF